VAPSAAESASSSPRGSENRELKTREFSAKKCL